MPTVSVGGLQCVVVGGTSRRWSFCDTAVFGKGPQQLTTNHRGLVQTAAACRNVAEERIRNLIVQRVSQGQVSSRELVPLEILCEHVDTVISDVGNIHQIVIRQR